MKHSLLVFSVIISAIVATAGCSTPQGSVVVEEPLALAEFTAAAPAEDAESGIFCLGAGDALGYAIFVKYIAYVRANGGQPPYYAGAEPSPGVP